MTGRLRDDGGAIMVLAALMTTLLLALVAFAVDLGWFFINANRVQRTADAAALAGVIHMPDDYDGATATALEAAAANGFSSGAGSSIAVTPAPGGDEFRLQVTVADAVPTFFLKVLGRDTQTIRRTAVAEYIQPLPMGSPDSRFGNDPATGFQPNFWANVHGPFVNTGKGDAYSALCAYGTADNAQHPSCGRNPAGRSSGYLYGLEVGPGEGPVTVQILDGAHHREGLNALRAGDFDASCETCDGITTVFTLYAPSDNPLRADPSEAICSHTYYPEDTEEPDAPWIWEAPLCSVSGAGLYRLGVRVVNDDPGYEFDPADTSREADDAGLNRYSLRATNPAARLYALGDMSIFNAAGGVGSGFYLAEVDRQYAGRTLVVELYDPGDTSSPGVANIINVLQPDGPGAWDEAPTCRWFINGVQQPESGLVGSRCAINADRAVRNLDGRWVRFEIDLPTTYTCDSNCWWRIRYDYGLGTFTDSTTWRAFILGNPVRLVLGEG